MRCVVFGATGYIGGRLVPALAPCSAAWPATSPEPPNTPPPGARPHRAADVRRTERRYLAALM